VILVLAQGRNFVHLITVLTLPPVAHARHTQEPSLSQAWFQVSTSTSSGSVDLDQVHYRKGTL
jgi:hypothetical protein